MTLDPFTSACRRTIETSFGSVRYRDFGDGPPLVFVHGILANSLLWKDTANRLATHHRCIVADWPLGSHDQPLARDADLSPTGTARLIAEVIVKLELAPITLIGNDTGGVLCQLVATEHPELVARLVLTPCDGFEIYPPPGFGYLRWIPRIPGLLFLLARAMLHIPALRRWSLAYGALTRCRLEASLLQAFVEPAARSRGVRRDTAKYLRGISPTVTQAVAKRLPEFSRPALLVWCDDERFFPPSLARRLGAVLPDARVVIVPCTGVFLPLDGPEVLADQIRAFTAAATPPAALSAAV